MLKQKFLEVSVMTFALIAIDLALASCLYSDHVMILRVASMVCILIAIALNFYSGYNKKKI